jgi:serine/threonine protein kinase
MLFLQWPFLIVLVTAINHFDLKSYQSCITRPLFDDTGEFILVHGQDCQYTDFEDFEYLGHGHSSIVYSSVNTRGLKVALKNMSIPKYAHSFRNEECMLAALQHSTIPNFYCSIKQDGEAALVMELIDGIPLFNALNSDQLGPLSAWRIVLNDSAELLHFLHSHGIVFCDFKPENIIIINDNVRIIDFGIAKLLDPAGYLKERSGTPQYMAPELIAKKPYDGAVDWYALGLTLYEMVMRHYPFQPDDLELLAIAISHGVDRTALPDGSIGDLIFNLMTIDPKERWGYEQISYWSQSNFQGNFETTFRSCSPQNNF